MAKIHVNKVDAARRQIDAAIRMLFDNGDPVPVHTLAAAGGRILRDLCEAKGTPLHQLFKDHIVPGKENEFWKAMNRPANFFKHADQDADEILDNVEEEVNDLTLLFAAQYYLDLGYALTKEMRIPCAFVMATRPNLLRADAESQFRDFVKNAEWLRRSSRAEQLAFGKTALSAAK